MDLLIVESPTKAKTISKFLNSRKFKTLASMGHVRDLPKSKLGVDTEHGFLPHYTTLRDHSSVLKEIKAAAKKADHIYFATDEDREGEAISWHLAQVLELDTEKVQRIAFHEITKEAVERALESPRPLDMNLINAQQARRILDRLVGYELSPFLWRNVQRGLSAGRVQSVAIRLIVEREREIQQFVSEEYWSIEGLFSASESSSDQTNDIQPLEAKLHSMDGKTLDKMAIPSKEDADRILEACKSGTWKVDTMERKQRTKSPPPPFTTSSLQQEANHRLGFSAKQTMALAQKLYEGQETGGEEGVVGLITYMRTDSVNLADRFVTDTQAHLKDAYGSDYTLSEPRKYKTKSKNAQEAHEAIRPTDPRKTPEMLAPHLDKQLLRLYTLIWQRALATQMPDATFDATRVDLSDGTHTFRATGRQIVFPGYLRLYPDQEQDKIIPEVTEGQSVTASEIKGVQHFTEPPARYSDATLVKALEEHEIGRPSTYAATISTILERHYVERDDKKRLQPTDIAGDVVDLLTKRFPDIVDIDFTARLESSLDHVAEGTVQWQPLIEAFYGPFHKRLEMQEAELSKEAEKEAEGAVCETCGKPMVVKRGRFGKFLACSGYPECKQTRQLEQSTRTPPPSEPTDKICEKCGSQMLKKTGRFGPFLACSNYPTCKNIENIITPVLDPNGNHIICPVCKTGQIIERRSKRGKIFFGCSSYPKCTHAFWDRPTGEACPSCGYATLVQKGKTIYCPDKENCKYKRTIEQE